MPQSIEAETLEAAAPSRGDLYRELARALQPGLRGESPRAQARAPLPLPLQAALVTWDPHAPIGRPVFDRAVPRADSLRRTLGDVIPEVDSGPVFQIPALSPPVPAEPHAVGQAEVQATLTFGPGHEQLLQSIATWVSVTDELLEDVAGLAAWLDLYLAWLVRLGEEKELLLGDGTYPHILGFLPHPAIPAYAGTATDVETKIAEMVGQAAGAGGLVPDTIVLPATDWVAVLTTGLGGVDGGVATLYGCEVIATAALTTGQALVGACQVAAVIGRSGPVVVEGTRSHDVDFVANKSAIRAAGRLALGVLQPSAFVKAV